MERIHRGDVLPRSHTQKEKETMEKYDEFLIKSKILCPICGYVEQGTNYCGFCGKANSIKPRFACNFGRR